VNKTTMGLIAARSFLNDPRDFCHDVRADGQGGHCAIGVLDVAFGYDPENFGLPHTCCLEWQNAIMSLAMAMPLEYRANALIDYRSTNLEAEAEVIQPMTLAVARYSNSLDFKGVCAWYDRVIAMRRLVEDLALLPELVT